MYRRLSPQNRRLATAPVQPIQAITPPPLREDVRKGTVELHNIPLPNEVELPHDKGPVRKGNPFSNILNRIHIDDLILLGLVFLFIDEGRNEVRNEIEDDLLIVILLYLFLAGRK